MYFLNVGNYTPVAAINGNTAWYYPMECRLWKSVLNIDNPYFEGMVNRIYPPELQLNKANNADTEAPFLDLHLSISNGFVSSKIYDKRDDFDFDIVNFPFLDGDVPRSTSYGVYISQLIRFARVSSHVVDFNARNKSLTAKLLQQGYRYHKLRKTFERVFRRTWTVAEELLKEKSFFILFFVFLSEFVIRQVQTNIY